VLYTDHHCNTLRKRRAMRILIVEDDPPQRLILRTILTRAGYEVLEAADGQAAWNIIQQDSVPLVITDWMMPHLDGLALINHIRQASLPYYTYVLLLTARDSRADVVEGLHSGADDYLTKPVDPEELKARILVGKRVVELEASLRAARDQLHDQATHDQLTGLLNRRALYERAAAFLSGGGQQSLPISVLLVDVDKFKLVNDQHGHGIGDQALQLIAQTIEQAKRASDLVARWGGEEFMLFLPRTALQDALGVAERIRLRVADVGLPLPDGGLLSFHVSVGVACTTCSIPSLLETLVHQADEALYQAKRTGRNRVCYVAEDQHIHTGSCNPAECTTSEILLYEARQVAKTAYRAKDAFLAIMVLHICPALDALCQMMQDLLDTELSPEQRLLVESLQGDSHLLLNLVKDMSESASANDDYPLQAEHMPYELADPVKPANLLAALDIGDASDTRYPTFPGSGAEVPDEIVRLRQLLGNLLEVLQQEGMPPALYTKNMPYQS
jgi:two-component system chemotaxis response regulator CheY